MKLWVFTIIASSLLLIPVFHVQAETPCGNITAPIGWDSYFDPFETLETKPVSDCANPFGMLLPGVSPTTFYVDGKQVVDGEVVEVPGGVTSKYQINYDYTSPEVRYSAIMFKHVGANYDYFSVEELPVTEAEYRALATEFFTDPVDIDNAVTRMMSPHPWEGLEYGSVEFNKVDDFYDYVHINLQPKFPPLGVGTYTLVFKVSHVFLQGFLDTLLQRFAQVFLPIAYAAEPNTYKITFTIKAPTPEPTGASSVLFLPGIMGSRLYEDADGCNTSGEGQQRWVSLAVCDQLRLLMSPSGNAINDIYTKSGQSSILVSQVYKSFFDNLNEWKSNEIIKDYVAVPYDWRLGLDNLLKAKEDEATGKIKIPLNSTVQEGYLYKTLKKLASESKSGKVTIVAHSNGGLLAKALLATLDRDNDPLLQKVDALILVASPQLGTPDALVGMLHGSRIVPYLVVGNVVSQKTSRQLLGTMPFAYHLLPSTQYFNGSGVMVNTPVLTFDAGTLTTPWVNTYGGTVNTSQKMQAFMQTSSGRVVPDIDNLEMPAVISGIQFNYSNSIHLLMNAWIPASTTKVYEIAGTGVQTVSGIRYYTGRECGLLNPWCVLFNPKVLYQVKHTIDGDGTVVVPSALGMSTSSLNVERRWLNLDAYNRSGLLSSTENKNHGSIFDVSEVNTFIKAILESSTTTNYQYITEIEPSIPNEDRLDFYLHSPLDMFIRLSNGKEVSSSSSETNDGIYRRYGELQYVSIPNTPSNKSLILKGLATGSFTLEIEEYKNGSTTKRQIYSAIPSSTSTQVTVSLTDSSSLPGIVLAVDYDGNGSVDVSYDTLGQVTTYADLKNAINALIIPSIYKKILLETAKIAEQNYQKSLTKIQFKKVEKLTLNVLKQQIILYGKLRIISVTDQQKLINIIDNLLNK